MSEPKSTNKRAKASTNGKARNDRVTREMVDSFDEELEMEIDDDRLGKLPGRDVRASRAGDRRPSRSISRSCSACRASW